MMTKKWISSLLLAGVVSMTGCKSDSPSTVADVPAGPGPITASHDPSFGFTGPVALKAGPTTGPTYGAYNSTPDAFTLGAPAPTAGPALPVPSAAPLGGGNYVVRQGDTLWSISRAHYGTGQRWKEIVAANPGLSPERMPVGRAIVLP